MYDGFYIYSPYTNTLDEETSSQITPGTDTDIEYSDGIMMVHPPGRRGRVGIGEEIKKPVENRSSIYYNKYYSGPPWNEAVWIALHHTKMMTVAALFTRTTRAVCRTAPSAAFPFRSPSAALAGLWNRTDENRTSTLSIFNSSASSGTAPKRPRCCHNHIMESHRCQTKFAIR